MIFGGTPAHDAVPAARAAARRALQLDPANYLAASNLARLEMTVAVEEFLKRIPEFHLTGEVTWSEGSVRGPRKLPLRFG